MKKIILLFGLLFVSSTFAQVEITKSEFMSQFAIGNTYTTYQDTTTQSANIGSSGENTWDFSALVSSFTTDAEDITPSTAPKSSLFANATSVLHQSTTVENTTIETWVYAEIADSYKGLGHYIEGTQGGVEMNSSYVYNPPEIVFEFPLTFNATWTNSGTREIENNVGGFSSSSTEQYTITKTVDAYGSMKMPDGTVENALRITVEAEYSSNYNGVPVTTNNIYYEFISPSGAYVEINPVNNNSPQNGVIQVMDASWHYNIGTATDVEKLDKLPSDFSLSQNYPNPFNPATNIQFSIPERSQVSLKVYDVLGNEVATLVDKELSPGVYNNKFDGSELSSGIYFYSLRAGNFTSTKKLMLVK